MLYVDHKNYIKGRFGDLVSCMTYSESPSTQLSPFFIICTSPLLQIRRKHSKYIGSSARKFVFLNYSFVPNVTAFIQGVSRLQGITAGGDFLGLCD